MIRIDPLPAPWWSRVAQRLRRRRRMLAAAAAAAATCSFGWTVLAVVTPAVADVVVTARPVAAGTTLTADDVTVETWPVELLPDLAVTDPAAAIDGGTVTAIARGEVLTSARLSPVASAELDGRVSVVAGLADPWSAELVAPGSRVDVYPAAAGWVDGALPSQAGPVARDAVVIRLLGTPPAPPPGIDIVADPLPSDGTALVLAVRTAEVPALAALAGQGVTISTAP